MLFRAALPGDAYVPGRAGHHGRRRKMNFYCRKWRPEEMLAGLMARSIKQGTGGLSWRNCFVAVDRALSSG